MSWLRAGLGQNPRWGAATTPAQGRLKGAVPVAVLDIGSNSVRLVIYEQHARTLTPLYNEKSAAALGRGVAANGRLADANMQVALTAIQRFALVARQMQVGATFVLATSAVREAANGPEFSARVADIMRTPVVTLSGTEEAHYAALGVVAGMPHFSGLVGDLGGGSLELSNVALGRDGEGETLPLGVIRLQDDSGMSPQRALELARERLAGARLMGAAKGGSFCAIGGTWRSFAKLHQMRTKYPLHMVQDYTVPAADIVALCDTILQAPQPARALACMDDLSSTRRELVPYGAAVLRELVIAGDLRNVVFSAMGVREGYLFSLLPEDEQQVDPLLRGAEEINLLTARSPDHAADLDDFSARFFAATDIEENGEQRRMRTAACYLSDIGWRGHPDYRGEQSVGMVAYGAMTGIDHAGRALLAETLAVRYMGLKHKSQSNAIKKLSGPEGHERARLLGTLFRVAYPLSAAMPGILPRVRFEVAGRALVLVLPPDLAFLDGTRLAGRLKTLAQQSGYASSRVQIG